MFSEIWDPFMSDIEEETDCFFQYKTEEEIKKYTLKEDLTPFQRAKEILTNGDHIQKMAIYKSLPTLAQEKGIEEKLLIMIVEQLESQEPEIQVEVGNSFLKMIEEKKIATFKESRSLKDIFQLTLNMLHVPKINVIDIWIEILQQLLLVIPFKDIHKDIISEINDLSDVCSPAILKYSSMKITASAIKFMGNEIEQSILEHIQLFCQLNDFAIKRAIISGIMPTLFSLLQTSVLDTEWLPLVITMIKEDRKEIQSLAIKTLAETIPYFSSYARLEQIYPLFTYLMNLPLIEGQSETISRHFGQYCHYLEKEIHFRSGNSHAMVFIQECFENIEDEEVRTNLAYNFPCLVSQFWKQNKEKMNKILLSLLMKDKSVKVRTQIIKGIHQISKTLGVEETRILLKQPFKTLLQDQDANEIRVEFVQKVPEILQLIAQSKSFQAEAFFLDIVNECINIIEECTVSPCWRLVKHSMQIFEVQQNASQGGQDFLERYASVLFKCMVESNQEVKKLSVKNLVLLFSWQNSPQVREYLFSSINSKLLQGRSYQLRLTYLEIVQECIMKLSRSFFKQFNLLKCMQLANDSVPNVRRKLASMIIKIRNSLFKDDFEDIKIFDQFMNLLVKDKDKETARLAQEYQSNLREIDYFKSPEDALEDQMQLEQDILGDNKSLDIIEKNYSYNSMSSSKRKNINVKKLTPQKSINNTNFNAAVSLSAPKSTSIFNVPTKTNSNKTSSPSPLVKPFTLPTPSKIRTSPSFNGKQVENYCSPSQTNIFSSPEKMLSTSILGCSSSSQLKNPNYLLSPIINQMTSPPSQKVLSPFELNTLCSPLIYQQNEQICSSQKEISCRDFNKNVNLKPLSKVLQKKSYRVVSGQFEKVALGGSTSIINQIESERKVIIPDKKGSTENNPNKGCIENNPFAIQSPNLYRIKKQSISNGLPPKIPQKRTSQIN